MPQVMRNLVIDGHPSYQATSDGQIIGPNHSVEGAPTERMGQFFDPKTETMFVIMFVQRQPHQFVPLAFEAAPLIAHAWGAPKDYKPGFKDRNPMNLRIDNLMMPPGWHRDPNHVEEKPFKCPHCDFECKTSNWLSRHIREVHPDRVGKVEVSHV